MDAYPENQIAFETLPESRKFIHISTVPKSASSFVWLLISALQEADGRANPNRLRGVLPDPYAPLTPDIMALFPYGGTYKSHAAADVLTIETLERIGCKYIISTRHPADFIPALFCHLNRSDGRGHVSSGFERILGKIPNSIFQEPLEAAMAYLINHGPLDGILTWIADWVEFRDQNTSVLLRYEDLVGDFHSTLNTLSKFVLGRAANADTMTYLEHVAKAVSEAGQAKPRQQYPQGWTGNIGVWRRYFSEETIVEYNKVVERHLKLRVNTRSILSVYPDVLLPGI